MALFLFGFYHLSVGLPSVLAFSSLRRIGFLLYKLKIPNQPDPQFEYVLKPLGLYALSISLICFFAVFRWQENEQQDLLRIFAALLLGRGACRIFYAPLFLKAFGTTPLRNMGNAILTFVVALTFIALTL